MFVFNDMHNYYIIIRYQRKSKLKSVEIQEASTNKRRESGKKSNPNKKISNILEEDFFKKAFFITVTKAWKKYSDKAYISTMSSLLSQRFKEAFCSKQTVSAIKFVKLLTTGQLCSREFEQYELLDSDYLVVFLGCWGALLLKLENDNYDNNGVSDTNENISENINMKQHLYTHNLSIVLGLLQGCTEELAEVRKIPPTLKVRIIIKTRK